MIAGHCDASNIDDLVIDWDAKAKVMNEACTVRASVVARLLLARSSPACIVRDDFAIAYGPDGAGRGPSGL